MEPTTPQRRFAVLIDADNISAKALEGLLAEVANYGTAMVKRIYGDWTLPALKSWNGSLYACGSFQMAGGLPASRIARWDGAAWHALGSGVDGSCLSLELYDDGTGEALVETQRSRRQIDDTMRLEPLRFDELSSRVYGLTPRIEGMKYRVGETLAEQRAFLQSIAVGELQAQKQRLDVYTVQARFALAAIYDIAATVGESGE